MASECNINAIPKDTDIEVFAKYYQVLANLSIEQKLNMFFELNENMRSLMISGIKMLHPDFTQQQIIYEIVRRVYGVNLAIQSKPEP
jgi:hypothetical protein